MPHRVSIVLGTAQWGSDYGITNVIGRPSDMAIRSIVAVAKLAGINKLDTASRYGDAQKRIKQWASDFEISTKVYGASGSGIEKELRCSLHDLGVQRVHTLLIHDWDDLTPTQMRESAQALEKFRKAGFAQQIGVSTYGDTHLESARHDFEHLDVVQIPINALDGRLANSQLVEDIHSGGTQIQARSVMLQGLLAARSGSALGRHPLVMAFHDEYLDQAPCHAMAYVNALPWVDEMVLGVSSAAELGALIECSETDYPQMPNRKFNTTDLSLIDPRRWGEG